MAIREIKIEDLDSERFIKKKVREISKLVGNGLAINALSGGIDSSAVTMLGHCAIGKRLKTYCIDNGLLRQDEPEKVFSLFRRLGVFVKIINAREEFFAALKGVTDPEAKREAITETFYKKVFGRLVKESGAKILLQGTNLTDIEETVAGIKRQHNVFEQLGIDPLTELGYKIVEPLVQLRKDGIKKIAKALGIPETAYNKMPFPGPALATRIIGEVTPERTETVRKATVIAEEMLAKTGAFQYMAILHKDRATGMRDGKRVYGQQIQIRCWDSVDARTGTPTKLSDEIQDWLVTRIITEVPDVVSVMFHRTPKPPSTIEVL